ncbi:uncharacterized protein LOC126980158 isoform X2 [Leptidea sinapis]|uniref:uncharacterized protein LOC126980158 isoform X2 n=1 Tax=Leptidea sinapis TaxID=189913 RepID=UPI0021413FC5|nr:uncharacterized protein LOC126980158 isoform X2 [Leptidea sinapis]
MQAYLLICGLSVTRSSMTIRRAGWLDRLVDYHRETFLKDLRRLPVVQIKAKIAKAPPGYVDSTEWDYESVVHLLDLIRKGEGMESVRTSIRRVLRPSTRRRITGRRGVMRKHARGRWDEKLNLSFEEEEYAVVDPITENEVLIVSNPVEARLPSAMISIHLLKEILENRSKAARYMATTKRVFTWKIMNKTQASVSTSAGTTCDSTGTEVYVSSTANASEGEATSGGGATGGGGATAAGAGGTDVTGDSSTVAEPT